MASSRAASTIGTRSKVMRVGVARRCGLGTVGASRHDSRLERVRPGGSSGEAATGGDRGDRPGRGRPAGGGASGEACVAWWRALSDAGRTEAAGRCTQGERSTPYRAVSAAYRRRAGDRQPSEMSATAVIASATATSPSRGSASPQDDARQEHGHERIQAAERRRQPDGDRVPRDHEADVAADVEQTGEHHERRHRAQAATDARARPRRR